MGDSTKLVAAFVQVRPQAHTEVLGPCIARFWADARQAWPQLEVDPVAFLTFVASKVPDDADAVAAVDALRPGDLLLAYACLSADPAALAAFEAGYLSVVPAAARRLHLSTQEADEVRQRLAQRLLMGTQRCGPRLAAYAGRGDLRNWVRTAAVRLGQNLVAAEARRATVGDEALERAIEPGPDPQLDHLRRTYGARFKASFEEAVDDLSTRERTLLRLHFVEGMTSDALATLYDVHRATAARWVSSARDRLAGHTRRRMMRDLGVGRADLQSIMRLIQSQLDVSVRRCLRGDAGADED